MNLTWTVILLIHLASLIFLGASLYRISNFLKKFRLQESRYTLIFGFMDLPQVIFFYVVTILLFITGTFFITFTVTS